jgi:hypothetical protein
VTSQDIGDCLVTDRVAQFGEFTLNSVIALIGVLLRKSDNQTFELLIDSWSTAASTGIVCPFAFHQLPMPTKDSFWLEDANDLTELVGRSASG